MKFNTLVLCFLSAGVGRTGVFITLSIVLERMRYEGVVDLFQTVKTLRTQRPAMVQTEVRGGPRRVFLLLKLLLSYFTFNFKRHLIEAQRGSSVPAAAQVNFPLLIFKHAARRTGNAKGGRSRCKLGVGLYQ